MNRKIIYGDFGTLHTYEEVWKFQKHLQSKIVRLKRAGSKNVPGFLLLCEHAPVITLGKSGKEDHLQVSLDTLKDQETEFFKVNRGGDITFHGPGQITGYPIFDLDQFYNDVHRYVRDIEEVVIKTLSKYGIKGIRIKEYTGVWVEDSRGRRKICAIGIHMSRWVSMHGFALNVNTDLSYFQQIVPCGIQESDMTVTSISKELNSNVDIKEVRLILKDTMKDVFGFTYV